MNWPALKEKLDLYERLMRLDKPHRATNRRGVQGCKLLKLNK